MDFCTFSTFASRQLVDEVVHKAQESRSLSLIWNFGLPSDGFELAFHTVPEPTTKENYKVDLFFLYPATKEFSGSQAHIKDLSNYWIIYLHWTSLHGYKFYHVPKIMEFCSSDFFGYKIQVPCDPLPTIMNDYGETEWKVPVSKGFDNWIEFQHSERGNMSKMIYWNKTVLSQTFTTYTIE